MLFWTIEGFPYHYCIWLSTSSICDTSGFLAYGLFFFIVNYRFIFSFCVNNGACKDTGMPFHVNLYILFILHNGCLTVCFFFCLFQVLEDSLSAGSLEEPGLEKYTSQFLRCIFCFICVKSLLFDAFVIFNPLSSVWALYTPCILWYFKKPSVFYPFFLNNEFCDIVWIYTKLTALGFSACISKWTLLYNYVFCKLSH